MVRTRFAFSLVLAAASLSMSLVAAGEARQPAHPFNASLSAGQGKPCPASVSSELTLQKASSSFAQGQYPIVIQNLRESPLLLCDPQGSLLLAAAYEESIDFLQAEKTLQQAHSAWPANTSLAVSLAREYLSQGRKQEAANALNTFRATASTPWQEIQLSVVVFLANQQLAVAENLAELGFKTYPSLDSLLLLANALQLEGRYKDVIALLTSKRDLYPTSAKFLVTLAESEYDAAAYDPARSDLSHAILLEPSLYQAHYLLGNILLKQGDASAAKGEYEVALGLSPNQPRTYYHLALALRAMHEEDQEEEVLSKAISLDPDYASAHCELGRVLLNQDRIPDAVRQLELAEVGNKSLEETYSLLSRAYQRLGNTDKAEEMAQKLSAVRSANHEGVPDQASSSAGRSLQP